MVAQGYPTDNPRVGFIASNVFQLFHFRAIAEHLRTPPTIYVEVREDDFGIRSELIHDLIAGSTISWVESSDLASIDGECDILVCQTPVASLKFFDKSLLVAQQYSLAKESYQYGPWRAQPSLNLMYGGYSADRVRPYATAVCTGNPLLDGFVPTDELLPAPSQPAGHLRVLYMPTYGDLSDRANILDRLMSENISLSVKAHHADFEIIEMAKERNLTLYVSDTHPAEAIRAHDLIVSDYSGAIYDALALRTPVVVASGLNGASSSLFRLSEDDLSHKSISHLVGFWEPGGPLQVAYERSSTALSVEQTYVDFITRFYSNLGEAGVACARAIEQLSVTGDVSNWNVLQVRSTMRRYIETNRDLRRKLRANRSQSQSSSRELGDPPVGLQRRVGLALANNSLQALTKKSVRIGLAKLPYGDKLVDRIRLSRSSVDTLQTSAGRHADSLSVIPRFRRSELSGFLEASLAQHGLVHAVWESPTQRVIAVDSQEVDRLHSVLTRFTLPSAEEVSIWRGGATAFASRQSTATLTLPQLSSCTSVIVGARCPTLRSAGFRESGVEIALIDRVDDRFVARRKQLEKQDWTTDFQTESTFGTSPVRVTLAERSEDPVDVVYTWVDSNDPEWERQRRLHSDNVTFATVSAANEERFVNRDELRYSIRSLWMYAPFVRNIYIVTAGQRPVWLPVDSDRIRVVSHSEIFPNLSDLPTFNSHAIEACLHRIPGLAERFLYLNDDFFLSREVTAKDFYTQAGLIKSRFSPSSVVATERPSDDAIPTDWASYNAVTRIHDDFGLQFTRKAKHLPYVLTRSLLEEMEAAYPEAFVTTRSSRFRAQSDFAIPSMFAQYYAIATHQGVEWPNIQYEYAYADTGRADFPSRLRSIAKRNPTFFCLNGTLYRDFDFATQAKMIEEFLAERYPVPSPFEADSAS